ncbi:DUF4190 domain-containing protein [Actinomadura hibisca]|uniref:DUF4190 domain-containing protein n=1 Tax=Actinomadura hibisca TaxID=68565 RepID=UPI00082E3E08|nr:DUF4190 domain-containing protein [Actinomadura hibisca]
MTSPPGAAHHPRPPFPPRRNGLATAAFVLGVLGFLTCALTSLFAVVFGHVAAAQTRRSGELGRGTAQAGAVLGWLGILLGPVLWLFLLAATGAGDALAEWINEQGTG